MGKQYVIPLVALVVFLAGAVTVSAAQQTGRYVLKQTDDGFLRLDTETGSVAHCMKRDNKWQCDNLKGGNASKDPDLALLKKQNLELHKRVMQLEAKVRAMSGQPSKPRPKLDLPSDQEIDEMMGFFEKLVSRFMRFARTLQGPPSEDI